MKTQNHFYSTKRTGCKLTVAFDTSNAITIDTVNVRPLAPKSRGELVFNREIGEAVMRAAEDFANTNGKPPREARIGWIKPGKGAGRDRRGEVLTMAMAYEDDDGMVELFSIDLPDGFNWPPGVGLPDDPRGRIEYMHRMMLNEGKQLLEDPHVVFMLCPEGAEPEVYVQSTENWSIYDHQYMRRFLFLRAAAISAVALVTGAVGRDKASGDDLYMIGCELDTEQHHAIVKVDASAVVSEIKTTDVEQHLPFKWDVIWDPIPGIWDDLPGGRVYADHLREDCTEPHNAVRRIKHLGELAPPL